MGVFSIVDFIFVRGLFERDQNINNKVSNQAKPNPSAAHIQILLGAIEDDVGMNSGGCCGACIAGVVGMLLTLVFTGSDAMATNVTAGS
jgi:hypothetical protein